MTSAIHPIFFQAMVDAARDAILLMAPDGKIVYANPAVSALLGYPSEELINRPLHDTLVPPLQRSATLQGLKNFHQQGVGPLLGRTLELTAIHQNGHEVAIELSLSPLDHGELRYAVGILRDIAPRKRAEAALRRRLQLEQAVNLLSTQLAEENPDLTAGLAALGGAAGADRAYLFRFSPDHTTTSNTHEWCAPGVRPQMAQLQDLPLSTFPWWNEHILKRQTLFIDNVDDMPEEAETIQMLLREQNIRSLVVVPLTAPDGVIDGFMGFDDTHNIGKWRFADAELLRTAAALIGAWMARNRAQQALEGSHSLLHAILNHATVPIFAMDHQGRFTLVNPATCLHNGYSQEELLGMPILDLLTEESDKQKAMVQMANVLQGRQTTQHFPATIRRKDGAIRHILVSSTPLELPGSESIAVGYSEDITERLAAEGERNRLTRALRMLSGSDQALVRARDESSLIAEVCHVITSSGEYAAAWVCAPVAPSAPAIWGG